VITALVIALTVMGPPSAGCPRVGTVQDKLELASVAFVGRVDSVSDDGETASVRVEQVWKGGPVLDQVTIVAEGFSYRENMRYLFMPDRDGGRFRDSATCTLTQPYSAEVAQFAPETVTLPRRSSSGSSGMAVQGAIAGAVVLIGLTVAIVVTRLRRWRVRR
jgi:hypothetical protein